ncbi:hypothetical protein ACSMFX_04315 [Pseudomonas mosselii]|uniref:hypothetical protein n=1 Tax=Pseudomonas mosselii TaxID=78327 RepID=UPI003F1CA622
MKTLHLTHTDIESDSRILKEMGALAAAGYAVSGLGVALDEGAQKTAISFPADIVALNLGGAEADICAEDLAARHYAA